MSNSFEKSVKGGTKIKLAAPKSKYVEHILVATHAGEAGVGEVFRALQNRLRDATWTIVFKSLIIVHLMIREGEPNVTLKFLAGSPSKLAISSFSDGNLIDAVLTHHGKPVQAQGANIRHYYMYILSRAKSYRDTRVDWVRDGQGRLKRQTVDKGLLRETESVQTQIATLLKCDLLSNEPENEITLTAFRLLTMDLLILYHVMNEGTINVLEHYFEMSKYDAERALAIYKTFSKQTNQVVEFLSVARQYENATRLEIPKLKHAPTSLTGSLEEYLSDPDFEINRRQYLAQQDAKKGTKAASNGISGSADSSKKSAAQKVSTSQSFPIQKTAQPEPSRPEPKGPAPDLIDFFESIEQNQQPMAGQPQKQISNFQPVSQYQQSQAGYSAQPNFFTGSLQPQQQFNGSYSSSNPFDQSLSQQLTQPTYTGSGFGTYSAQPQRSLNSDHMPLTRITDESAASFPLQQPQQQQSQSTNPFRQSVMIQATGTSLPSFTGSTPVTSPLARQSTNPFAKTTVSLPSTQLHGTAFAPTSPPVQVNQSQIGQSAPQQQSMRTGTNPFARTISPPQQPPPVVASLAPNPTGSTNPFRQSQFVNQQTGQEWQSSQGSMGGLERLDTFPVFPRPGPQPSTQQQVWP